jgi:hypothetical protein
MNCVEPGTPITGPNKMENSLDFPGIRTMFPFVKSVAEYLNDFSPFQTS